jgi:hypothetical protein
MLYIGSLDSSERMELFTSDSNAMYANGYLIFVREGTLLAQPFDAARLQVTGESFQVAQDVDRNVANGQAAFSVRRLEYSPIGPSLAPPGTCQNSHGLTAPADGSARSPIERTMATSNCHLMGRGWLSVFAMPPTRRLATSGCMTSRARFAPALRQMSINLLRISRL